MSNHYTANTHLFRVNLIDSNLCDCGGYEDIDHIVFKCPMYHIPRTKLLITLRTHGAPPNMQVRDALGSRDLSLITPIYNFIKYIRFHI